MNWETGIDVLMLLCLKSIIPENRPYSTGNSTQGSVVTYTGRKSKKEVI